MRVIFAAAPRTTRFAPCRSVFLENIMRAFLYIFVILYIAAMAEAFDFRREVYVHAPDGMGTGIYYTVDETFQITHYEHRRCGPEKLPSLRQRIMCHGVFATCDEWMTMAMRTDGVRGYQLFTDRGPVPVEENDEVHLAMALGLANACRDHVRVLFSNWLGANSIKLQSSAENE